MRWLVRFLPSESPRDMFLSSIRALARSVGAEARNPKWASNGALELDIFCPTNADFETFLAAASPIARTEFVTDLNKAPEYLAEGEILSKARRLFNAERYWECHEVLEGLWRQKQGEEKRLLQGIILLCAAYVHHQKGEAPVAFSVLRRAIPQLESSRPTYWGFRVQILKAKAESMLRAQRFENFRV